MAGIDVHEIQRHRRAHEVSDPKAQQVPIECKGRVDVGHHQHRMSHALRPSTETRRYAVPGGMVHRRSDHRGTPPHGCPAGSRKEITSAAQRWSATAAVSRRTATPAFSSRAASASRAARVRDLPAEKTLSIRQPAVDDQALLAVIHAEGTHGAAAINR